MYIAGISLVLIEMLMDSGYGGTAMVNDEIYDGGRGTFIALITFEGMVLIGSLGGFILLTFKMGPVSTSTTSIIWPWCGYWLRCFFCSC